MSLTLYLHPFSSYCQKALIALYEANVPFTPRHIDLRNPADAAELKALWPMRKFPVLRDEARNETVPESSIIVEYLVQHYPGAATLIPTDRDEARHVRLMDRFFDAYVMEPMSKIVVDNFRPEGQRDALGVAQARATLATAYDILERDLAGKTWAAGAAFTLADCAAAPSLFYADLVAPVAAHKHIAAYLERLLRRPSVARAVREGRATLMEGFPYRKEYLARYESSVAA